MGYSAIVLDVALLLLLSTFEAEAIGARQARKLEARLAEAVEVFVQYSLPNSMARPSGFDIDAHRDKLNERFQRLTRKFHRPEAAAFLSKRVDSEQDEMAILAILRILYESREPVAEAVLTKYALHSNEVVARSASEYLETFKYERP